MQSKILVTGACGFIGSNLIKYFSELKSEIIGIDNFNDYYDVQIKKDRKKYLCKNVKFINLDIKNKNKLKLIFKKFNPDIVIHLAAQPGVRYSLLKPQTYIDNNISGTLNILELSKEFHVNHVMLSSTSSVYGKETKTPYFESSNTDTPLSFYAASKKSMEIIAYFYSSYWNLPITIFRFFTVYGPWGRPDMALYKFTDSIINNKIINLNNHGEMWRDYTFIDDLVKSIYLLSKKKLLKNKKYEIYNIGTSKPIKISNIIKFIEKYLGKKAKIKNVSLNASEMKKTFSDTGKLKKIINYTPSTNFEFGLKKYLEWHRWYYEK